MKTESLWSEGELLKLENKIETKTQANDEM